MAGAERSQLISLELTIEHQVRGLSQGQASQVRTKIWGSLVREEKGIGNLISLYTRTVSSGSGRQTVHRSNYPMPHLATTRLSEASERIKMNGSGL